MSIRELYRRLLPEPVRQLRWTIEMDLRYIFGDRQPTQLELDYDGYWERREQEGRLELSYADIADCCEKLIPENARVLDIGCGNGAFLLQLKNKKNVKGLGVDISPKAVALSRAAGIEARTFDVLNDNLDSLGHYDYVTAFEVLEHIPNPEALLSRVRTLGSKVLVTIPNTGYYLFRLRLLLGRFPRQWIQHPAEHLRFWTLKDFRLTAELTGYTISRVFPIAGRKNLAKISVSWFAGSLLFVLTAK